MPLVSINVRWFHEADRGKLLKQNSVIPLFPRIGSSLYLLIDSVDEYYERGLLSIVLSPTFESDRLLYVRTMCLVHQF